MPRVHRQPLDQFRVGAYRPQRWDAVTDLLDDGYVRRLPASAKEWMSRFMRAEYGANSQELRQGLHADMPRAHGGPVRLVRWWRGVERAWPGMSGAQRDRAVRAAVSLGLLLFLRFDSSRRLAAYNAQNAATRDVYSLRRVVYLEELGGRE